MQCKDIHFVEHSRFGIQIAYSTNSVNVDILNALRAGFYEWEEIALSAQVIAKNDRVLELGGGLGALTAVVAKECKPSSYIVFEANPEVQVLLSATLNRNGIYITESRPEILTNDARLLEHGYTDFYVSDEFWISSIINHNKCNRKYQIPTRSFSEFAQSYEPTVIVCDIEGGEMDLFGTTPKAPEFDAGGSSHLRTVHTIILELHPWAIGDDGVRRIDETLRAFGFADRKYSKDGNLRCYQKLTG